MRVLVTGGAGFIGSHVVDRMRAAGIEVRIFDIRPSAHHASDEVESFLGDVMRLDDLRAAMRGCDVVAHLAAAADVDQVRAEPLRAEAINARGTLNVLQAAREAGVERVLYASTVWVYSDTTGTTADEESALAPPRHLYTATKLAGEMYCRAYRELYGLPYTILRFGIPYGPRARPAAVIPTFVRRALAGEALTVAGDGRQARRFIYVEDLAEGVVRALCPEAADRVYNLVGSEDVTVAEIVAAVRRQVGATEVVHVPGRRGDLGMVDVGAERAAQELGWQASTPFGDGLARYVAWHRGALGAAADATAASLAEPEPAPAPAPVVRRWRWAVRGAGLRRAGVAIAVALFLVPLAAVFAAVAGVAEDPDGTSVAGLFFVLPPLLVVTAFDGDREGRRALMWGFAALAAAETLAVLLPFPASIAHVTRAHAVLLLLGAVAAGAAALLASAADRRWAAHERAADSPP
ncbi:MAG: UDP-glucose 4-epimerase [Solirubrobacteraceae bacterium]|nr:UDP-glucose 4-epimerase [Solirubrobacteraceae bacterium]